MGKKIIIITTSLLLAFIVMSSGYSKWSDKLIIEGDITVVPIEPSNNTAVNTTSSSVIGIDLHTEPE